MGPQKEMGPPTILSDSTTFSVTQGLRGIFCCPVYFPLGGGFEAHGPGSDPQEIPACSRIKAGPGILLCLG